MCRYQLLAVPLALTLAACDDSSDVGGTSTYGYGYSGGGSGFIGVTNYSSYDIYEVYITACTDAYWGYDLLGGDIIPPGYEYTWSAGAGCYDVLAIDAVGSEWTCYALYVDAGGTSMCTI